MVAKGWEEKISLGFLSSWDFEWGRKGGLGLRVLGGGGPTGTPPIT